MRMALSLSGKPEVSIMRHLGVYSDDEGRAFLVLEEADAQALAGIASLAVTRTPEVLALAPPGSAAPLFSVDLEAELDLRVPREIGLIIADAGDLRILERTVHLMFP
jgi:hypothetical protein